MPFTKGHTINLGKKNGTVIRCKYCGKERYLTPRRKGTYCSLVCAGKDNPPTWLHQEYTPERNKKVSDALKGKFMGKESRFWKGDGVGYRALHEWVERNMGKADRCERNTKHKASRYHWANISREYKRDLSDWVRLCPKCHFHFDRKGLVIPH